MSDVRDPQPTAIVTAIEARSIDWVPEAERHGKVWRQGPFWFLGNFQPFTLGLGFIGPSLLGLSFTHSVIASVLGILFGTIFMAFHASQGPTFGLPQMVQSRAQFGYRGVVVPLLATGFTFLAFNVVDTVIIKEGLNGIFGWSTVAVAVVITVLGALLAIFGHDWLHRAFQLLFWLSLPFWIILSVAILSGGAGGAPPADATFSWASFFAQFTVVASYNITYAVYVSDYSRYLPKDTRVASVVGAVFIGAAGSPIWLIPIGAWIASRLGETDAIVGIDTAGDNVFGGLGGILAVLSALALVATMGLNAYSGALTVITAMDSVRPLTPTRRLRVTTIIGLAVVWLVLGLTLTDAINTLLNTLIIMLYLLAPWTAINLIDYFFVRRGHYAVTDLFTPRGIYGAWGWRGLVAYLAGIVVQVPFVVLPYEPGYTGWIASNVLQLIDVSWLVGMIVGGGLYLLFVRSLLMSTERTAVAASERVLAQTGAVR